MSRRKWSKPEHPPALFVSSPPRESSLAASSSSTTPRVSPATHRRRIRPLSQPSGQASGSGLGRSAGPDGGGRPYSVEERAEQRHLAFLRRLEERNRQVKEARAKDAARLHAEQLERGFTTHWSGANEDKQRADRDRAARERKQRILPSRRRSSTAPGRSRRKPSELSGTARTSSSHSPYSDNHSDLSFPELDLNCSDSPPRFFTPPRGAACTAVVVSESANHIELQRESEGALPFQIDSRAGVVQPTQSSPAFFGAVPSSSQIASLSGPVPSSPKTSLFRAEPSQLTAAVVSENDDWVCETYREYEPQQKHHELQPMPETYQKSISKRNTQHTPEENVKEPSHRFVIAPEEDGKRKQGLDFANERRENNDNTGGGTSERSEQWRTKVHKSERDEPAEEDSDLYSDESFEEFDSGREEEKEGEYRDEEEEGQQTAHREKNEEKHERVQRGNDEEKKKERKHGDKVSSAAEEKNESLFVSSGRHTRRHVKADCLGAPTLPQSTKTHEERSDTATEQIRPKVGFRTESYCSRAKATKTMLEAAHDQRTDPGFGKECFYEEDFSAESSVGSDGAEANLHLDEDEGEEEDALSLSSESSDEVRQLFPSPSSSPQPQTLLRSNSVGRKHITLSTPRRNSRESIQGRGGEGGEVEAGNRALTYRSSYKRSLEDSRHAKDAKNIFEKTTFTTRVENEVDCCVSSSDLTARNEKEQSSVRKIVEKELAGCDVYKTVVIDAVYDGEAQLQSGREEAVRLRDGDRSSLSVERQKGNEHQEEQQEQEKQDQELEMKEDGKQKLRSASQAQDEQEEKGKQHEQEQSPHSDEDRDLNSLALKVRRLPASQRDSLLCMLNRTENSTFEDRDVGGKEAYSLNSFGTGTQRATEPDDGENRRRDPAAREINRDFSSACALQNNEGLSSSKPSAADQSFSFSETSKNESDHLVPPSASVSHKRCNSPASLSEETNDSRSADTFKNDNDCSSPSVSENEPALLSPRAPVSPRLSKYARDSNLVPESGPSTALSTPSAVISSLSPPLMRPSNAFHNISVAEIEQSQFDTGKAGGDTDQAQVPAWLRSPLSLQRSSRSPIGELGSEDAQVHAFVDQRSPKYREERVYPSHRTPRLRAKARRRVRDSDSPAAESSADRFDEPAEDDQNVNPLVEASPECNEEAKAQMICRLEAAEAERLFHFVGDTNNEVESRELQECTKQRLALAAQEISVGGQDLSSPESRTPALTRARLRRRHSSASVDPAPTWSMKNESARGPLPAPRSEANSPDTAWKTLELDADSVCEEAPQNGTPQDSALDELLLQKLPRADAGFAHSPHTPAPPPHAVSQRGEAHAMHTTTQATPYLRAIGDAHVTQSVAKGMHTRSRGPGQEQERLFLLEQDKKLMRMRLGERKNEALEAERRTNNDVQQSGVVSELSPPLRGQQGPRAHRVPVDFSKDALLLSGKTLGGEEEDDGKELGTQGRAKGDEEALAKDEVEEGRQDSEEGNCGEHGLNSKEQEQERGPEVSAAVVCRADVNEVPTYDLPGGRESPWPTGRHLTILLLDSWGDQEFVGLTGLQVLCGAENPTPVALCEDMIDASPRDLQSMGYHGDPRTLDKLFNGVNQTVDDMNMWLVPKRADHFVSAEIHIDLQSARPVAALRVWNYNKVHRTQYRARAIAAVGAASGTLEVLGHERSEQKEAAAAEQEEEREVDLRHFLSDSCTDTDRGVRALAVYLDGRLVSGPQAVALRKGPGTDLFAFGQTVALQGLPGAGEAAAEATASAATQPPPTTTTTTITTTTTTRAVVAPAQRLVSPLSYVSPTVRQDYEVPTLPQGLLFRLVFIGNWGHPSEIALNALQLVDGRGRRIRISKDERSERARRFKEQYKDNKEWEEVNEEKKQGNKPQKVNASLVGRFRESSSVQDYGDEVFLPMRAFAWPPEHDESSLLALFEQEGFTWSSHIGWTTTLVGPGCRRGRTGEITEPQRTRALSTTLGPRSQHHDPLLSTANGTSTFPATSPSTNHSAPGTSVSTKTDVATTSIPPASVTTTKTTTMTKTSTRTAPGSGSRATAPKTSVPVVHNTVWLLSDRPVALSKIKLWNYAHEPEKGVREMRVYVDDKLVAVTAVAKAPPAPQPVKSNARQNKFNEEGNNDDDNNNNNNNNSNYSNKNDDNSKSTQRACNTQMEEKACVSTSPGSRLAAFGLADVDDDQTSSWRDSQNSPVRMQVADDFCQVIIFDNDPTRLGVDRRRVKYCGDVEQHVRMID